MNILEGINKIITKLGSDKKVDNITDGLNQISENIGGESGSGSGSVFRIPVKHVDMGDDFWWELDGITFDEIIMKVTNSNQLVYLQLSRSNGPIQYYPFYFYPSGIKIDGQGNPQLIFSRFEISSMDSNISFNCTLLYDGHFINGAT